MARALAYARGDGPIPRELEAGRLVDRFGAQAVYGHPLAYREMRRITAVENIVTAYQSRNRAEDWVTWVKDNPELSRLLNWAESVSPEE